ncbi:polysaccharide biosynthesis/export family protein [Parafrankia sp. BMG5.11]|uniref:polysaccharide biosynthesis/export family protein n=1 Tax=Parafrankia sp. BMG5.11 TaxID=222540 RepID=UPI00103C4443|nr:polysaccharide biosynthesis/export family protein [Parafrankia sp. BMG5.11]TCJ39558.1 polysaccharide export protein [Parafrankia sp. BMG5.11]
MNSKLALCCLTLASAFIISGCATRDSSVPYSSAGFGAPDQVTVDTSTAAEGLVPSDKVRVTVFQEPDVSGEFEVSSAGTIDFPILGLLEVQGLSSTQVSELIRSGLAASYLRDPKVQVAITEAAVRKVTVEGAVGQSGVYSIDGPITLIQAVALARGTTTEAQDSRVVVFRVIDGQRQAAAFDLDAIRRAEADDPRIYGNDVVVVPGSKSAAFWTNFLRAVPILGIFRPF